MASKSKQIEQTLGRWAFSWGQNAFTKRSTVQAEQLGIKLGNLGYRVLKRHRTKGILSLEVAYPELSLAERDAILRQSFQHFGIVAGDFLRALERSDEEIASNMETEGLELGEKLLSDGKGILAVLPHFGNWERLAHWFKVRGGTMSVVARHANDSAMEARVGAIRKHEGLHVIGRDGGAKEVFKRLAAGEIIGILPDQNSEEAFLPFFGKPAGTVLGPAKLAQKTGAPLLPVFCPRVGPGRYRLIIKPVVDCSAGRTPQDIMTDVNAVFEEVIRQYPGQYLWLHDRWKSARRRGLV